jgi:hypothetical protein
MVGCITILDIIEIISYIREGMLLSPSLFGGDLCVSGVSPALWELPGQGWHY